MRTPGNKSHFGTRQAVYTLILVMIVCVLLVLAGLCLCICAVQSGILTGMIIPIDPNAVEFVLKSKACIDRLCSSLLILTDSIRLLKYLNTPSETCSHVYWVHYLLSMICFTCLKSSMHLFLGWAHEIGCCEMVSFSRETCFSFAQELQSFDPAIQCENRRR